MSYKRVIINSKDRNKQYNDNPNNFIVNIKDGFHLQQITKIQVESVTISNLQYNINRNNNVILWQEGIAGPQISRTIEPGQYTTQELIDELIIQLNSIGSATFNVTQDAITKKIIITNTSVLFKIYKESSINPVIGLSSDSDNNSVLLLGVNTLTSPFLPNLGGLDMVFIHSRSLAGQESINTYKGVSSVLSYLSLGDTPFGATTSRFIPDQEIEQIIYSVPRNIKNIDIKVRDEYGQLVDLSGSNVIIVLRVFSSE